MINSVSILIPCFNEERTIKKILDKVLKVNLGNISKEIIIINDGSTDQTRKLLENYKHEKLKRNDYKYDLLIPIKYNFNKPLSGKGSCIFIHLTKDYKPTAGCIALKRKDYLIMLRLINKKTKIKIT